MNTNVSQNAVHTADAEHPDHAEIRTFGFWIYLMSDLVLFSVLFATYAVIGFNSAGGPTGKELFDIPYLFIETMFLLFSSVAFGFTMIAMHNDKKQKVILGLIITALLGLGFIGMEIHEFVSMIGEGAGPDRSGFLSAFFTLVGTHGAHVTFGLIWIVTMIGQIAKKGITEGVSSRMMRLSLFWHFLDIVWIGVFSFVYLLHVV
jgi:cytochrome o ubiquinol oxidase subunit III